MLRTQQRGKVTSPFHQNLQSLLDERLDRKESDEDDE
jgi:hypothetical protein